MINASGRSPRRHDAASIAAKKLSTLTPARDHAHAPKVWPDRPVSPSESVNDEEFQTCLEPGYGHHWGWAGHRPPPTPGLAGPAPPWSSLPHPNLLSTADAHDPAGWAAECARA